MLSTGSRRATRPATGPSSREVTTSRSAIRSEDSGAAGKRSWRLERAASYYADGETTGFETIAESVTPDWAYSVEIERFRTKVGGRPNMTDLALRVTCVYRREEDGWKLVHRHADPRVERQAAGSVIQN